MSRLLETRERGLDGQVDRLTEDPLLSPTLTAPGAGQSPADRKPGLGLVAGAAATETHIATLVIDHNFIID